MNKRVAVIGGGIAGMQTALRLKQSGIDPVIIERDEELGGKIRNWYVLFPTFTPAAVFSANLKAVSPQRASKSARAHVRRRWSRNA